MSTEVAVEAPAERSAGELSHRQILTILGGLLLGMFLAALDQTVVSTAIRTIADDLGGLSEQAWATTAFLITSTISTPLYGKLSDIYGRKPLFLFAISVFIIGSITCTFATSMYQLAGFRALQGIGAGGLFSMALTILGDIVPPRERARYQGLFLAVFGTSSVLGPIIGGLLSGQKTIWFTDGWRWIFLVNVPIGVLALVVVAKVLNIPHVPRSRRIDWPGAVTLAIGLVPLLIIAEQGREWGWDSGRAWLCYAIGAVGLIAFVLFERYYGDEALLPLRLFRTGLFTLITLVGVIVGMGMFGGIFVLPLFLQIVHGATPIESGYLMLPLVGGIMVASLASGQLTARTGRYKIFPVIGIALMIAAMVIMYFRVSVDIPLWELDLYMAMFGLGLGNCMQTLVLAVQNAMPARDMGVVTASSTFFRQLGGTLGTAIFLSVVFSTVPSKIASAFTAAQSDPAFQAAVSDPAVRADPVNAPFFAALSSDAGSNASGVLNDSSFLQKIDPRLAQPFLVGFSNSIVLTFLIVAGLLAVAFVLVLFVKEVPLRTMSGAQAAAQEAAEAAAGPAGVSMSKEAATAELTTVGAPVTVGAAAAEAERRAGRHAMTAYAPASANGRNGNGHHEVSNAPTAYIASSGEPTPAYGAPTVQGLATQPGDGPEVYGVVNRGDGVGLPQVVVTVADPTGRQEARTATDATGAYRVPLQHGGTYLVVAAAGTYQPHAALVAVSDRPVRHDVSLTGTSAVLGVVRAPDPTGGNRPVPGITVTLIDVRGDVAAAGVTDPDGRYHLTGMPDGSYTLTAAGPGHQPVAVSLRLDVGATLERDLELPRRSRLLGTVTAASNGRGVPEAIATLVDSGGTVVGSTVTGPDGTFVFEDLSEGTYTLTASGYAPVAQVVQVTAGAQSTAAVELGTPGTAPRAPEVATNGNGNDHQVGVTTPQHVDVR
ncbi:MAG: DHA2 family efflux MFS transporter permease subunit [Pseudonocardia sp.]|uniref:MFS transporter n=1 Tax=Pseudonocardia sp. TaxID=60912 RepID=UPI001AC9C032|nr:MFS transporter [Pseudonocardia sp.]MBN9096565.1 DHA2 family efflux MFS transporter permease subunit [Pseudonocardia sp.]